MEKIIIILISCSIFLLFITIYFYSGVINTIKKERDEYLEDKKDLFYELEKSKTFYENSQKHINDLEKINENNKILFSEMNEDMMDTIKSLRKANKRMNERIENISNDFDKRSVVGSRYKVGDIVYHKYKDKIIKRKINYICIVNYGIEYDVSYGFNYYDENYEINEDDCYKDYKLAQMFL